MVSTTNQYKIKSICRGSFVKEYSEYSVVTEASKPTKILNPEGVEVFTCGVADPLSAIQLFLAYENPFNKRPHLDSGRVVKFFQLGDSSDFTFTIVPTPSDAIVTINGEAQSSLTADKGTEIEWSVAKEGYHSQEGTYALNASKTENVTLVALVNYYAWTANDLTLYTLSETPETTDKLFAFSDNEMVESETYSISAFADSTLTVSDGSDTTDLARNSEADKSL